jgi:hypothetical protein
MREIFALNLHTIRDRDREEPIRTKNIDAAAATVPPSLTFVKKELSKNAKRKCLK